VEQVAGHAAENLNLDESNPLFESTVQTLTNLINVITMLPSDVDKDFMLSLTDPLSNELRQVGTIHGLLVSEDNCAPR